MIRHLRETIYHLPPNMIRAGALLIILPIAGTLGYMVLERWSFLDSLYMTVIVLTTIGFREVRELDDSGKIFTMILAVTGVGAILYALLAVFQFLIEGEFGTILGTQRMKGQIERLQDHFILCGFGRVGEEIAREFVARDIPFVVVEQTPEAVERAERRGFLLLVGDATNDEILRQAGVDRARCLLAASDSDSGNTFITLSAKALNPGLFVVARAAQPESQSRLQRAGADRVFSPYIIAGRQMAVSALQPMVVEFIDTLSTGTTEGPILAELEVSPESGLEGRTVAEILSGVESIIVLGVQHRSGQVTVGPAADEPVHVGDRLLLMGTEPDLEAIGGDGRQVRPRETAPTHRPPRSTPAS
jgi:voltage-gated potassium channel